MLLLFVLMGAFAGFTSARLYKTFKGKQWQHCTVLTALLYPGLVFGVFFLLDILVWSYGSTGEYINSRNLYCFYMGMMFNVEIYLSTSVIFTFVLCSFCLCRCCSFPQHAGRPGSVVLYLCASSVPGCLLRL